MSHYQPYYGKQALLTHESSHDTFDTDKHFNWLVNGARLGIYVHGRVHQQLGHTIYVGDLIHKRGHMVTDDLLLMEEQALDSMGEPLSTNSRLGPLLALAVLPTMSTANGEGDLIAYYRGGVVSFNTFEAPRESRFDGEGNQIQKGWDSKRLINHLLNTISAVGRYAVTTLTRDHLFRSVRGLHFLKTVLGEGTFNSENVNRISSDVDPVLEQDELLTGAATGFWSFGNRMLATTGLVADPCISSSSFGRGFVVWNQATTYTEDRTPRPAWEGLWTVDHGIKGIHKFIETQLTPSRNSFGFVCSDKCANVRTATFDQNLEVDRRDNVDIPIEWSFETGQFAPDGLNIRKIAQDCLFEGVFSSASQKVRVLVRTDVASEWAVWKTFSPCDKIKSAGQYLRLSESLGKPPLSHREATWFQLRVEGVGYAEIALIELDYSGSTVKSGRQQCSVVGAADRDFFEINSTPMEDRWK
jgi:hypothetical protein